MPFARAQGKKISILHNRREGRRVRQLRLHVFDSFAEAEESLAHARSLDPRRVAEMLLEEGR